jgi:hypothetical protein
MSVAVPKQSGKRGVADAVQFTPPRTGTVVRPFEEQHWPALQMLLHDPDGRQLSVEAPLPSTM